MAESDRRCLGRCRQGEDDLPAMGVGSALRAWHDTEGRCDAAFGIPWKSRAAGVSREGGGLGEGITGRQECGLRRTAVASRPAIYAFGVMLEARAVVGALGRAFGSARLTGRLAARLCWVRRTASAFDTPSYARLLLKKSIAVVGKAWFQRCCAWCAKAEWRRWCVWRDRGPVPVVLERVLAGLAAIRRTGGRCRCVLAMGNSVAPVVHLVVAHHKDSQCAAVLHRSVGECA